MEAAGLYCTCAQAHMASGPHVEAAADFTRARLPMHAEAVCHLLSGEQALAATIFERAAGCRDVRARGGAEGGDACDGTGNHQKFPATSFGKANKYLPMP